MVGHVPQHEVAVDLVKAVAGIEESRPKTGPQLVAGEFGFLSRTGIDPGGEHTLGADTVPQGCVAGQVAIFLLLSSAALSLVHPTN
jgi:hypothetical protein